MGKERSFILSIAGFDPSGGAGILADIKTFESFKLCGMGVVTTLTFQNDSEFDGLKYVETKDILKQIEVLTRKYEFNFVKIGLIQNLELLEEIILKFNETKVQLIWDPIVNASAGWNFHFMFDKTKLVPALKNIFLLTPNTKEAVFMTGIDNPLEAAKELSNYCNVLLKGGHNEAEIGVDYLFANNKIEKISPTQSTVFAKHGSGCVLSSAIASNLTLGNDLLESCRNAKNYTEKYLTSHESLLGLHYV